VELVSFTAAPRCQKLFSQRSSEEKFNSRRGFFCNVLLFFCESRTVADIKPQKTENTANYYRNNILANIEYISKYPYKYK